MRNISFDANIDLRRWCSEYGADNTEALQRLLAYLPQAMEEELTDRQRQTSYRYFYDAMNVTQIAQALSLNPSPVSRTLQRATQRLLRVLRYTI